MLTHPFMAFKVDQKALAKKIRDVRDVAKLATAGLTRSRRVCRFEMALAHKYRIRHIAYCLARGRNYDEVEAKVHPAKKLSGDDQMHIDKIRTDLENKLVSYRELRTAEWAETQVDATTGRACLYGER